jgi:hypothetical protein
MPATEHNRQVQANSTQVEIELLFKFNAFLQKQNCAFCVMQSSAVAAKWQLFGTRQILWYIRSIQPNSLSTNQGITNILMQNLWHITEAGHH